MTAQRTIAVLGSEGLLGSGFIRELAGSAAGFSRQACDICDFPLTRSVLLRAHPAIIINAAGYTKVDLAEREASECMRLNADAVENLAAICNEIDALLVQISTDYVFGGDESLRTPYLEDDTPAPQSIYARSKLLGEQVASNAKKHLIVRTCGLFGPRSTPTQAHFVDTILRLAQTRDRLRVVDDQHCTPSSITDIARATLYLARAGCEGVYHVVNRGATTWHCFAVETLRLAGSAVAIDPITTAEYGAAAPRPSYSVLDTSKYALSGGPCLPTWQAALAAYLQRAGIELRTGKADEPRAA